MSSSPARSELVPHPVRMAALSQQIDCTVWARFRTVDEKFDPAFDDPYRSLAGARVNLVCSNGAVIAGETDTDGELYVPGAHGTRLVVPNVQALAAEDFHFEIVGPAVSAAADLTAMQYESRGTLHNFPIAQWSTRGWQEPEGQWGHFKLANTTFPAGASSSADPTDLGKRSFTIGCHMFAHLKFVRNDLTEGYYPSNLKLVLVQNSSVVKPVEIRKSDLMHMVFFDICPQDTVEFRAYFEASAISQEQISKITGNFRIHGGAVQFVPGETFGLPAINCVGKIRLYDQQLPWSTVLPPFLTGVTKLQYASYLINMECRYDELHIDEKISVVFNWFLEFISFRNIFIRAMTYLLNCTTKITWVGLFELELNIDDDMGVPYATNYLPTKKRIHGSLEYILLPRKDIVIHELGHTFVYQYISQENYKVYFPAVTNSHSFRTYSNEFFAFSEGFPQFFTSLFMEVNRAYPLGMAWPNFFKFQAPPNSSAPAGCDVILGDSNSMVVAPAQLEPGAGLALETAFAASLTSVWLDSIWSGSGTNGWIEDVLGDGELYTDPSSPNAWLNDPALQARFSKLIDVIKVSLTVEDRRSTRQIIDELERATSSDPAWPWSTIAPLLAHFRVVNEPFVSTIQGTTGNACVIARSDPAPSKYGTRRAKEISTQIDHALLKQGGDSLTLRGIRLPPGLFPIGLAVNLARGSTLISAQTARLSEFEAKATFTASDLAGATGMHDLVVSGASLQQTIVDAVEVVP